jgi:hypothetical protein
MVTQPWVKLEPSMDTLKSALGDTDSSSKVKKRDCKFGNEFGNEIGQNLGTNFGNSQKFRILVQASRIHPDHARVVT